MNIFTLLTTFIMATSITGEGKIILSPDTYIKVNLLSSNRAVLSFIENGRLVINQEFDRVPYDSTIHILLPYGYELGITSSKNRIAKSDKSQFVNWIILGPYFVYLSKNIPKLLKTDSRYLPNLSIYYITPSAVNLEFNVSKRSQVKITLYDISGRYVVSLMDKTLKPGNYSLKINSNKLTPGIYIAELKIDGAKYSKKFVLLH